MIKKVMMSRKMMIAPPRRPPILLWTAAAMLALVWLSIAVARSSDVVETHNENGMMMVYPPPPPYTTPPPPQALSNFGSDSEPDAGSGSGSDPAASSSLSSLPPLSSPVDIPIPSSASSAFDASSQTLQWHRPKFSHVVEEFRAAHQSIPRTLVISGTRSQALEWMTRRLPLTQMLIYIRPSSTDPPSTHSHSSTDPHTPHPGGEPAAYLSYITTHYAKLPATIIFLRGERLALRNNLLLDLETQQLVERLSSARVQRLGYVNLRCHTEGGCDEGEGLHLDRWEEDVDPNWSEQGRLVNGTVWKELFPGVDVPLVLKQPGGSQFAVSSEAIRSRPKDDYVRMKDWVSKAVERGMSDAQISRVFEYFWHFIFMHRTAACPAANACYCDGYGLCFGGAGGLENWIETYGRGEKLQQMILGWQAQRVPEKVGVREELERLNEELGRWRREAYVRGKDVKNRALEAS
ncbi:hypothetical protein K402DRAFT_402515 [Aulographum hederae CBS 113979]|uniref:Uncharacterized protein n=1 Tax=Aulographum hederae CBS 113979 TaxID=1176131 RepID=A0A6G1H6X6_9PEZI|nr:hypothetical protein K402DRAFT_402515 [Aulographum hederae CBS 113979]